MRKLQWDGLRINTNLINKYDIHFNFILTKPVSEIVYNNTNATTTIAFKDAVIFADNNEYLKRYYFLKNALDKDQIYDRINLLAQFYGNAVLLRYQYPLMILTKTKSIFQKRLKRMKKNLVEQGSSDQSKSNRQQKAISINSSQFLKSLSSSQLQRKSLDDGNNLQLDFSLFREIQYEVYDIFQGNQQKDESKLNLSSFNLINLAQNLTQQLIIQSDQNQEQLKHLMLDFDQFDKEDIIKKYQKIMEKENCRQSSKQSTIRKQDSWLKNSNSKNPMKIRELMQKKPMASSITITALEDNVPIQPSSPNIIQNLKKKSMLSPQRINSQYEKPNNQMKRSSYYQYEMDHHNFPINNEMIIAQDEMEDSPRHNHKKIKKFPSMDQQDFHAYNNQIRKTQNSANRRFQQQQPQTSRQAIKDKLQKKQGFNTPIMKYSSILTQQQNIRQRPNLNNYQNIQGQRYSSLPFRNIPQDFEYKINDKYGNPGIYDTNPITNRYSNINQPNRMTSINININNLEEKKEAHRVNVKFNNKNKYGLGQDFAEEQRNYRAQKKRKIRQKAAALLNRVKSQQYMRTNFEVFDKDFQFDNPDPRYYERYY